MVSDPDIVRDMGVCGDEVVGTDGGQHAASLGAAVNCDELADLIVIADSGFRPFAPILQILRRDTDAGIREKHVVRSDGNRAFYKDVSAVSAMDAAGSTIAVG